MDGTWLALGGGAVLVGMAAMRRGSAARKRRGKRLPARRIIGVTPQGDPIYQAKKTRRRGGGGYKPKHKPPHRFVDPQRCVCGATYQKHRGGADWNEAYWALSSDPDTFVSPGMIRGYMRDAKLLDWYMCHVACEELGEQTQAMEQQLRAQGGGELGLEALYRLATQREARLQARRQRQWAQQQQQWAQQVRRDEQALGQRMAAQIRAQQAQMQAQAFDLDALLDEAAELHSPPVPLQQIPF